MSILPFLCSYAGRIVTLPCAFRSSFSVPWWYLFYSQTPSEYSLLLLVIFLRNVNIFCSPHLDRRMQDRNLNIQFHQTWGANGARSEVPYQVELEERPRAEGVTDDFVAYNVVGGWTSDSDTRVIATIAPTKDIWNMMVLNGRPVCSI